MYLHCFTDLSQCCCNWDCTLSGPSRNSVSFGGLYVFMPTSKTRKGSAASYCGVPPPVHLAHNAFGWYGAVWGPCFRCATALGLGPAFRISHRRRG